MQARYSRMHAIKSDHNVSSHLILWAATTLLQYGGRNTSDLLGLQESPADSFLSAGSDSEHLSVPHGDKDEVSMEAVHALTMEDRDKKGGSLGLVEHQTCSTAYISMDGSYKYSLESTEIRI